MDALGEKAIILRELSIAPPEVAARIEAARLPGVVEAVASYETVGVFFTDGPPSEAVILAALSAEVRLPTPRHHQIPVCYELGEDLERVAKDLEIAPEMVVAHHTGTEYACRAVGFCPGFAYLGDLPDPIAGVPRRASPRTRIEPGSVAITGRQTGVYPLPRPGGWAILGRTPLTLVDVADDYFPLRPGDTVRFVPIPPSEFAVRQGERL